MKRRNRPDQAFAIVMQLISLGRRPSVYPDHVKATRNLFEDAEFEVETSSYTRRHIIEMMNIRMMEASSGERGQNSDHNIEEVSGLIQANADISCHTQLNQYIDELKRLKENGSRLRSDEGQPDLQTRPSWFDPTLFENAKSVYERHFMGINFAHLSGLILLVRINSIHKTLSSTGRSDSVSKLFRRYYQTVNHVKKWYEGDIFEIDSDAYRSLLIVRGMHNKVSSTLNSLDAAKRRSTEDKNSQDSVPGNVASESQVHISQYDIMLTQFAFVNYIATKAKNVGLIDDFTKFDLESILHFWRVVGYYLGAGDEYNLCSRTPNDVAGLCNAITNFELKKSILDDMNSSPSYIMSLNIVRSVKFIPMLTFYGITKYLFELMELDTSGLEAKSTRYSRLSYNLIKLVMSHLLAYRPLRWFNNGLTRLSIYCVGKVEDWFAGHLQSKYGEELKV